MASDLFKRNEVATVAGMAGTCGNARRADLLAADRRAWSRPSATRRSSSASACSTWSARSILWTVVRRAGRRSRTSMTHRHSQSDSAAASIPIRRSSASATTITSRPPRSSGIPGVQIHHSRDLVHWRLLTRPLSRASQLNMLGDPDSCGVWAPCLTYADGLLLSGLHRRETLRPDDGQAARPARRSATSTTTW